MTTASNTEHAQLPVLIIGAGPSGLLLAQVLRRHNIPFRLFERDEDFTTRGIGWGLTLNWSLPVLRELLPEELGSVESMRGISVDRASVEAGVACRFPFFDLATGERCMSAPAMPESKVMRVTRKHLRRMLSTDIPVEFNKSFKSVDDDGDSVTVSFDDGTSVKGSLLVGCDGGKSRVRRHLAPELARDLMYEIPIRLVGLRVEYTVEEMAVIQQLDPFFFHATSSTHGTFMYMGALDAPSNNKESTDKYCVQYCISWPFREGVLGRSEPIEIPASNEERHRLVREIASTWAEPFRSLVTNLPADTELNGLVLSDWLPPIDFQLRGRCTLMGDALHMMSMYRGEGVSHALEDVKDFVTHVLPCLRAGSETPTLRDALSTYELGVVRRVRPGVLASRQAAMDGHRLGTVPMDSPLLTRRERNVPFPDPLQP